VSVTAADRSSNRYCSTTARLYATALPSHITHADTKQGVQQLYDKAEATAEDVAEIIAPGLLTAERSRHSR